MMVSKVLPLLWFSNPFTFSSKKDWGRLCFRILRMSKNAVPLVSENPFLFPAIEKGWQGKPASKTSWSGISFSDTFEISPWINSSPKLVWYVFTANLFHSLVNTHSIFLVVANSNPKRIPPIPANKSTTLRFPLWVMFFRIV